MRTLDSGKWVLKQFFFETFEELAESKMDDVERLSMCEDTAAGGMLRATRMSWNPA